MNIYICTYNEMGGVGIGGGAHIGRELKGSAHSEGGGENWRRRSWTDGPAASRTAAAIGPTQICFRSGQEVSFFFSILVFILILIISN